MHVRIGCVPLPSYMVNMALIQDPGVIIHNYSSRLYDAIGSGDLRRVAGEGRLHPVKTTVVPDEAAPR